MGVGDGSWLAVADRIGAGATLKVVTENNSPRASELVTPLHSHTQEHRPVVYISYGWMDAEQNGQRVRVPDPRPMELAESLRAEGIDVRLDQYAHEGVTSQLKFAAAPASRITSLTSPKCGA